MDSSPDLSGKDDRVGERVAVQGGFAAAVPISGPAQQVFSRGLVGYLAELCVSHDPVLELCASTGILTGQLQRAGVGVFALDVSLPSLTHLRRALPGRRAVQADPNVLPFTDEAVGLLLVSPPAGASVAAMFPVGVPRAVVAEWRRVIRPGGRLVVVERTTSGVIEQLEPADLAEPCGGFERADVRTFGEMTVTVWS